MKQPLPERRESLWLLAVSPAVWSAHFLACYVAASLWCGKRAAAAPPRGLLLALTLAALAAIAVNGWSGWRRSRRGAPESSREFDTDEDRHRFLGAATLLLSALSFAAAVYTGAAALSVEHCR